MQLSELQTNLLEALRALTDWGRENTSPRDPNSPHALLVRAAKVIAEADRLRAEATIDGTAESRTMTQYYVVKDRENDFTVRAGRNGDPIASFTTRKAAMAYIDKLYIREG